MGFFDRLNDFGDREAVRTCAMKIDIGLQQIAQEMRTDYIKGLSSAVAREVQKMLMIAGKLTPDSKVSLTVPFRGDKIPYIMFLDKIRNMSAVIVQRGGQPII